MSRKIYDLGDAQPDDVNLLQDYTADESGGEDSTLWGYVPSADSWKGYKNGCKLYLDWGELTRRWGPLAEPHA